VLSSRLLNAAVLGSALLVAGCDRESGQEAQPQAATSASAPAAAAAGVVDRSRKGSEIPDFVLSDPAGKQLNMQSLKGKPVLVNLWATWCAP